MFKQFPMYRSMCCIHTFWFLTLSSMTQPDFASVLFSRFFYFYYRVDFHQWPYFIFSPQFLFIFSMGLIFNFLKQNTDGQEQKVFWLFLDLNIGLLATFWESRVLGSEDGRSGRWYIFCSLCFQPLPDGTFFPKTMPAFLFSPFHGDYQKTFVPLFFQQKAGQNSITYGETAPTPL